MTKFIAPFFFLILFACTPNEEESSSLNTFQGVFSSEPPLEADVVFYKDIPYGSGDREKMDLLLPNNKALEGLVVFFSWRFVSIWIKRRSLSRRTPTHSKSNTRKQYSFCKCWLYFYYRRTV